MRSKNGEEHGGQACRVEDQLKLAGVTTNFAWLASESAATSPASW